jgi:hypothetical protein
MSARFQMKSARSGKSALLHFAFLTFHLSLAPAARADWNFVAHRGSANAKTGATSISVSPSAEIPAGAIVLVRCVSFPVNAEGDTNFHSVSDSKSHTWTKLHEHSRFPSSGNGATNSLWMAKLTSALTTSDTVTLSLSSSPTSNAKAIGLEEFSVASGKTFSPAGANAANGSSSTPSVTLSGLSSAARLWLGHVTRQRPNGDTYTQDSDYNDTTKFGTTGGSATSNQSSVAGYRIATLTGDTYNISIQTSGNWVAVLAAVDEVDEPAQNDSRRVILSRGANKRHSFARVSWYDGARFR